MTTPNPLDYAKPDQMVISRRRRLFQAWMIFGASILLTPVILVSLYRMVDPEGGNPIALFLGGAIFPIGVLLLSLEKGALELASMILLMGQLPVYGIILAIAHYKGRLRVTAIWLLIIHACFVLISLAAVTSGFHA